MKEKYDFMLKQLPYSEPFLFVDEIETVSEEKISGNYTFREDAYFYKGHFKDFPITPGVILIECMAQIGLVCFAIYLTEKKDEQRPANFVLSHSEIDFLAPIFPGEKVFVTSEKIYFRFHKLKCKVRMHNEKGKLIARGTLSGIGYSESILR